MTHRNCCCAKDRIDTRVIDKDGYTICFHCTANVAFRDKNGNPTRVIEISRDITELKKAEAEKDRLIEEWREAFEKILERTFT